jgi:carboxypeptidase C (cathepsin A)
MTNSNSAPHQPPLGETRTTEHQLGDLPYTAIAGWQRLFDKEKPTADLFHVAYLATGADGKTDPTRPVTFVFNGGPGAASAYLHMGSLGPKRVLFGPEGRLPKPPVQVVDNAESWLSFTDLVFVDPVGTGFSRILPAADNAPESESKSPPKPPAKNNGSSSAQDSDQDNPYWEVERDLESLGEFIQTWLSKHHRWLSPIFIAGESYGGYRVARLARRLQQSYGIGLSGAIMVSPALEFSLLYGSDYNLSYWISLIPSFAAVAQQHGLAGSGVSPAAHRTAAETFARQRLLPSLALGDSLALEERQAVWAELASLTGIPLSLVTRQEARLDIGLFARELLRSQRQIVGLYDASLVAWDPFPDRLHFEGDDPSLDGIDRLFTGAINSHLRQTLGVETDLRYYLLNMDVFKNWRFDPQAEFRQGFIGSVDDLRSGMALNPHMKVNISHGLFDLVTTYFSSQHLIDLMRLPAELRQNLQLDTYPGGHMFYSWDPSRQAWTERMGAFYQSCQSS